MHSLEHLLPQARQAYHGISFSPEKRGVSLISEMQDDLDKDLAGLPESAHERYAASFEKYLRAWIGAKSRCLSPMITGPSKFPVARNMKYNNQEQAAYERLQDFRRRAKKSIARMERGPVTVSGELQQAREQLEKRTVRQEYMKRINEGHRKYKKDPMGYDFKGFTDSEVALVVNYVPTYSWEPHPFAPYQLSNNNAQIKRYADRVKVLERKEAKAAETPETEALAGDGWRIVENHAEDRLQIFFDEKPDEQLRNQLKKNGYRWAPSASAWQRKLTGNARYCTRHFLLPILKQTAA